MAGKEYSKHQQNVIGRYYDNRDAIMLQKLQELVTELYLALVNLKVKPAIVKHILEKRSPEVLAMNIEDWLKKKK
jgi:hypothetical protein